MENINGGYLDLGVFAVVFVALQVWWISMTIRNGSNNKVLLNPDHIGEIKKRLEKNLSKITVIPCCADYEHFQLKTFRLIIFRPKRFCQQVFG